MEGRKRNPVFPAAEALAPAAGPKRAPGINEKAGPGTDSEMIEKAGPEKAPAAGKAGPEGVPGAVWVQQAGQAPGPFSAGAAVIYITGGARSGKSTLAEAIAKGWDRALYIATARALDPEMVQRVAAHRARRPAHWRTFEGCRGLAEAVEGWQGGVLLDCVTNLLTNLMLDMPVDWEHPGPNSSKKRRIGPGRAEGLMGAVRRQGNPLVLVSNEVGLGLVPDYPLGRAFRDGAGWVNQRLARLADQVYFCVSGIPLRLK